MADSLTIDTSALTALNAALMELSKDLTNVNAPLKFLGIEMQRNIKTRFENEGPNDAGAPWAALAESTRKSGYRKGRKNKKILQVTGTLRNSFVSEVTDEELTIGTNVFYAQYHNAPKAKGKMNRSFLYIGEEDQTAGAWIFQQYADKQIEKAANKISSKG